LGTGEHGHPIIVEQGCDDVLRSIIHTLSRVSRVNDGARKNGSFASRSPQVE
jgi:hypothetical protein